MPSIRGVQIVDLLDLIIAKHLFVLWIRNLGNCDFLQDELCDAVSNSN